MHPKEKMSLPTPFIAWALSCIHLFTKSFHTGRQIRKQKTTTGNSKNNFHENMGTSKCFATYDSKLENKPVVRFASIDVTDGKR
jgi:hypothetical protein